MIKQFLTICTLAGCLCNVSFAKDGAQDEFALLLQERIGDLRIDLPETMVKKCSGLIIKDTSLGG